MSESNGTGNGGRDPMTGRFGPGNRAARGNPVNRKMSELRRALLERATTEDVADIFSSLMESARAGDTSAARLLLEHLVGKPRESIELSGPDGSSLSLGMVVAAVMSAFPDDPSARVRIAAAFRSMGQIEAEATGDGVG